MNCQNDDSLYAVFGQTIRLHYSRVHIILEKIGVYPGQPPLLFALAKSNGQSQKELAEKLHIKPATITVMLRRMETVKLIERRSDNNDQRVTRVFLTEQGQKVLREVKEAVKVMEEECFKNFSIEEQILLRRFFLQMRENLMKVCAE